MTNRKQSYKDFQDEIFQQIQGQSMRHIAHQLIKMATDEGITRAQLIELIRTSDHEKKGEILDALLTLIDKNRITTP